MVRVLLIWLTLILMAGQAQAAGLEFLAEDEDLSQGVWVLLIHSPSCPMCRQYCDSLEAKLSKLSESASAARVMKMRVDHCGRGQEVLKRCMFLVEGYQAKRRPTALMMTPTVIRVEEGVVTHVIHSRLFRHEADMARALAMVVSGRAPHEDGARFHYPHSLDPDDISTYGVVVEGQTIARRDLSEHIVTHMKVKRSRLSRVKLTQGYVANTTFERVTIRDADLTGTVMHQVRFHKVTWINTICPDGKNSDKVGRTCEGNLDVSKTRAQLQPPYPYYSPFAQESPERLEADRWSSWLGKGRGFPAKGRPEDDEEGGEAAP